MCAASSVRCTLTLINCPDTPSSLYPFEPIKPSFNEFLLCFVWSDHCNAGLWVCKHIKSFYNIHLWWWNDWIFLASVCIHNIHLYYRREISPRILWRMERSWICFSYKTDIKSVSMQCAVIESHNFHNSHRWQYILESFYNVCIHKFIYTVDKDIFPYSMSIFMFSLECKHMELWLYSGYQHTKQTLPTVYSESITEKDVVYTLSVHDMPWKVSSIHYWPSRAYHVLTVDLSEVSICIKPKRNSSRNYILISMEYSNNMQ